MSSQERRTSITRDKTGGATQGATQGFITGQNRIGSAQNRRAASAALPRRSSFRPPVCGELETGFWLNYVFFVDKLNDHSVSLTFANKC